ncbi:MAG: ATP-dependent RNA helicase HrpA [Betaproteobacteria bacterium]|nr:ATP-dependent RNA helicase HrpA [Betaproteobacteria bacterium]
MKPDREASIARRLAMRPVIAYDETLPVNERRGEITRAIVEHQVIIVCGETGSGKTTQLPKICLELGRGCAGLIGHTQPRRIAARATATRIAQELNSEPGRYVGYKIRFTDRVTPETYIKLMTDGILLAETQGDPQLRAYDTIILDEAHERNLNIDFLLGFLKQLLPKRPDLKVIVTSATLDAEKFSRHFGDAPVIEVSGRLYPIEMRWRPVQDETTDKDRQLHDAIVDAVDEAQRAGPGDVLVFLPGEREIREAAEALRKHAFNRSGGPATATTEILPLFARQSAQEQSRVFQSHQGRRVVLATNVAETSLTVPGIRYVVDTGLARLKRYSHRNKIEQLQVEPIAQAAANQRAGRCGRVAAGICIRLYAGDDFAKRPPHTDPEILRSSLAGVILRMKSLQLGDVEDFPFLQPPSPKMVSDGYQLLGELGAVDEGRELTALGRELAKLPLDPKIGRMILAARDEQALTEVLVIAAALSVPDPRERPPEKSGGLHGADQAHAQWKDEKSEFLSYLKLWHAADEAWKHESSSKLKLWCRQNFISWLRLREWRDIHGQLHALCTEHGWKENQQPASFDAIHRALLSGLLGNIGLKSEDEGHYLGARGIKFFIHPGSTLVKKAGRWIMAAELMETTRLFARCLAKIEPEWLERVGAHLVKRHVYEPHWEKSSGQVVAWERATLHGLLLYAKRRVQFGRPGAADVSSVEVQLARELFIRGALVNGEVHEDFARRAKFFQHNRKLIADIEALEHKSRRPDVLVDDELIHAFYDSKLPEDAVTLAAFEAWRKDAEARQPKLLFLEREQLMRHEAAGITTDAFPHSMAFHGQSLTLTYHHDPGAADDGVTLSLPLPALNQISANRCEWLVPGLLKEKTLALLKTLPQKYRQRLQPLDAFAERFCEAPHDNEEAPVRALTRAVEETLAMKLPLDAFRPGELRPHLQMNFRLLDEHGGTLAMSRSLPELRAEHGGRVASAFAQAMQEGPSGEAGQGGLSGLTAWTFGDLPELLEVAVGGQQGKMRVIGFPALVDQGDSVALRVFDTPDQARALHRVGLRRLFALALREQVKTIEKNLPGARDLALQFINLGSEQELRQQLVAATLERTCLAEPLPVTATEFETRKETARSKVILVAQEISRLLASLLAEYTVLQKKIVSMQKAFPQTCADIAAQMAELLRKDFLVATPFERLAHYPRYLKAAAMRLDKARVDAERDARLMREWQTLGKVFEREWTIQARSGVADPLLEEFRWLLEELRVALFAQELRTPTPVSVKRLQKMWDTRVRK